MTRTLIALTLVPLALSGARAAPLAAPHSTAAAPAAAAPAEWRSFDINVRLENLPRSYTCDELWYRFHDVLLAIGARPDMRILTYHCADTRAASGRSPSVQLEFQLPISLSAAQARYADLSVVDRTIRLAPGKPHSLTRSDCELLEQMKGSLLAALPVQVVGATLDCRRRLAAGSPFALEVQALIPSS
jgi:hypothetical protein